MLSNFVLSFCYTSNEKLLNVDSIFQVEEWSLRSQLMQLHYRVSLGQFKIGQQ